MPLEFGGYTFAAGVIECVGDVHKSPIPGDLYEVRVRTRSGLEVCKRFPSQADAEKAREAVLSQLRH